MVRQGKKEWEKEEETLPRNVNGNDGNMWPDLRFLLKSAAQYDQGENARTMTSAPRPHIFGCRYSIEGKGISNNDYGSAVRAYKMLLQRHLKTLSNWRDHEINIVQLELSPYCHV